MDNKVSYNKDMVRNTKKDFLMVTPELFRDFLAVKKASKTCLSCGSGSLYAPYATLHRTDPDSPDYSPEKDQNYVLPVFRNITVLMTDDDTWEENMVDKTIYDAQYDVVCAECGFVRSHTAYMVVEWIKSHKGERS